MRKDTFYALRRAVCFTPTSREARQAYERGPFRLHGERLLQPAAEAMFNAVAEDRGLGFRVESAGVRASRDEPMAPIASAALEEIGVYAEGHCSRRVSPETYSKRWT